MVTPVICFDLDGTLVDHEGRIHPQDIDILLSDSEICWIPCTGRMLHSVRSTFAQNGLFVDRPIPFPMVLQNGAATYLSCEKLHDFLTFDADTQTRLIRLAGEITDLASFFSTPDELHVIHPNEYALEMAAYFGFEVQPFKEKSLDRRFGKIMCISDQPEPLDVMAEAAKTMPLERAFSMPIIFEATPPGGNKGGGLMRLLPALGRASAPVFVAGDGGNDLTLFQVATRSFAPVTSPTEIQVLTDVVVDPRPEGLLTPILKAIGYESSMVKTRVKSA